MRFHNYRTVQKNGKRVKEHSYMTLPKYKSIAVKGYKRQRSHGTSSEGGILETDIGLVQILGTGFLSFFITVGYSWTSS